MDDETRARLDAEPPPPKSGPGYNDHSRMVYEIRHMLFDKVEIQKITSCGICPYADDGTSIDFPEWTCHGAVTPGAPGDIDKVFVLGPKPPVTPPTNCPLRALPRLVVFVPFNLEAEYKEPSDG